MGMGPMTGWGAGYCAGYDRPGYAHPFPGRGFGFGGGGWGRGRRWRHWYHATGQPGWMRFGGAPGWWAGPPAPPTREQEAEHLRSQADWLSGELEAVKQRIADLEQEA